MSPTRRALLAGAVAAAGSATGAAAAAEKKEGRDTYLRLPTLTAPLLRPGGAGVMTAEAGVDAPDPAVRARVELVQPRLLDAYRSVLAAFAASLAPGAPPDLETLVARLQAATDRVVGRPGARFLIGTVMAE